MKPSPLSKEDICPAILSPEVVLTMKIRSAVEWALGENDEAMKLANKGGELMPDAEDMKKPDAWTRGWIDGAKAVHKHHQAKFRKAFEGVIE